MREFIEQAPAAGTVIIDDGTDFTKIWSWRINAAARARTKSCYVPPPKKEQVAEVRTITIGEKPKSTLGEIELSGNIISTEELKSIPYNGNFDGRHFLSAIAGKTLSCREMLDLLNRDYPGHCLTISKIKSRMATLNMSPHASCRLTKGSNRTNRYTLICVTKDFLNQACKLQAAARG
ncbi:hypothetical protein LPW36_02095 [Jinshanibacter sp. LJY008]|uniref:Uncharacterized protein n=1 Tax=Limnobaculum eriocheiris TaxID=2897391 RepID=A0A9X1SJG5_9GAMM|nr:hypothetical protein [Limnobaculum eriocheiris]MCD1124836.1 hypothetical protein [Limnobaculum eriocheiris]